MLYRFQEGKPPTNTLFPFVTVTHEKGLCVVGLAMQLKAVEIAKHRRE